MSRSEETWKRIERILVEEKREREEGENEMMGAVLRNWLTPSLHFSIHVLKIHVASRGRKSKKNKK